jgi:predicted nucleic acid-binding protein
MKSMIVDTGPLVALLNARDGHHAWARDLMNEIEPPLATCEAVLSEACFLVRNLKGGRDAVLELVAREIVVVKFRLGDEVEAVRKLMARYATVPMSLADACLVRMSELEDHATVLTMDGDFEIYRKNKRQVIQTLTPSGKRGA